MSKRQLKVGDKFLLNYCGRKYPYVVKEINGNLYLVQDSPTPLGTPLTSIPVEEYEDYDKEYGFTKVEA